MHSDLPNRRVVACETIARRVNRQAAGPIESRAIVRSIDRYSLSGLSRDGGEAVGGRLAPHRERNQACESRAKDGLPNCREGYASTAGGGHEADVLGQ